MSSPKKVLLVVTSASALGGTPTGIWLAELAEPWYAFKAAGYEITLGSTAGGACSIDQGSMGEGAMVEDGKKFMIDPEAVGALGHTVKLDAATMTDFDAVVVAGGHGCSADMAGPGAAQLKAIIEAQYASGKVVAADCHGPYALIECVKSDGTPLVAGLEVTAFSDAEEKAAGAYEWVIGAAKSMEAEFRAQGANYKAAADWSPHVVTAGNLITAQNPASAGPMAEAVIAALA